MKLIKDHYYRQMLYALDFDGVIADSMDECLQTSYSAYRRVNKESGRLLSPNPDSEATSLFKMRRGFVRPSRNFFALWEWILFDPQKNYSIMTFEGFADGLGAILDTFEIEFHKIRANAINEKSENFVEQNPLFFGVKEIWKDLPKPLYIVSTKDEESISLILRSHNLEVRGIYGRGSGPKSETLTKLANSNGIPSTDIYFVDDNFQHVNDVASTGARVALAMWGYGPFENFQGSRLLSFPEVLEFFLSK